MNARLLISIVASAVILGGTFAEAGNFKVDLNINLEPYRPIIVREEIYRLPPPVRYKPRPEYSGRDEVRFIYPEELGFYVAVGIPDELCYIGRSYYLFQNGRWLRSDNRRGPWVVLGYRELPSVLRQHRIERIRDYRQHGYARLQQSQNDRERYRDRNQHGDRNLKRGE